MKTHGKVSGATMLYSCLAALEEDNNIYIEGEKVPLEVGSMVIMRGDVVHSGAEYASDNIRYHVYMEVVGEHEAARWEYVNTACCCMTHVNMLHLCGSPSPSQSYARTLPTLTLNVIIEEFCNLLFEFDPCGMLTETRKSHVSLSI
jgi:hypothetical protein